MSLDIKYKFPVEKDRELKAYFVEFDGCAFPWNDPGVIVDQSNPKKTFGPIDISCATKGVTISMDLEGFGTDDSDYCRIFYKVDGAAPKLLVEAKGAFGVTKYSAQDIKGKKVEIIIEGTVSFSGEIYNITNLSINDGNMPNL